MEGEGVTDDTTVGDLVAYLDRVKKAMAEAGEPAMADRAHIIINVDGSVQLSTAPRIEQPTGQPNSVMAKAMDIDPLTFGYFTR